MIVRSSKKNPAGVRSNVRKESSESTHSFVWIMIKTMLLPIKYQLIFSVHVPGLQYTLHDLRLNNNY